MTFVCPLPPVKVKVRAEYLYDHQHGHGDFVDGVWVSVKSIRGEAFRFETYLPEYAALYDKLPIDAFIQEGADIPETYLPLDFLQIWDALAYNVIVVEKPLIKGLKAEFLSKSGHFHQGVYMFTLDGCNPDPRIPDFGFSETPDEHKSYNLLALDNGQFALQPNNRCRFYDPSLTPEKIKFPDFKVATHSYKVERFSRWRLGDTDDVMYGCKTEPEE
jgi:hypothetical protein